MDNISFDMSGRIALVTGASSGIGRQLCLDLASAGVKVVATARRTELLESLVAEIKTAGGQALAISVDVADEKSVSAAYDAAENAFGTVDTIYANAGTYVVGSSLELPMKDFNQVIQTNLNGVILTAREGASRLINAGSEVSNRGRIVITSSIRGQKPSANHIAYCASKAGTIMAGKVMALEWAPAGINVNLVCPGVLITDINEWFYETEEGKNQVEKNPRKRVMSIDDLKTTLLFLGSDQSRAITGSVFTIDDGQTL
jgi:NAD(P)-dependent dehydrogenase (short-subunit alcohol dehydrogenase family)